MRQSKLLILQNYSQTTYDYNIKLFSLSRLNFPENKESNFGEKKTKYHTHSNNQGVKPSLDFQIQENKNVQAPHHSCSRCRSFRSVKYEKYAVLYPILDKCLTIQSGLQKKPANFSLYSFSFFPMPIAHQYLKSIDCNAVYLLNFFFSISTTTLISDPNNYLVGLS